MIYNSYGIDDIHAYGVIEMPKRSNAERLLGFYLFLFRAKACNALSIVIQWKSKGGATMAENNLNHIEGEKIRRQYAHC